MVHEPPQIREARPERARDAPEGRGKATVQRAAKQEDDDGTEAEIGDARAGESHLVEGGDGSREMGHVC